MKTIEILLPKMGESIEEGKIITWLKQVGEEVQAEEPIVEIATDKIDTEIHSPHTGVLESLLCSDGDVVEIGAAIAIIKVEGEQAEIEHKELKEKSVEEREAVVEISTLEENEAKSGKKQHFYSPLVKTIAKKESISQKELESIYGTGKDARVTKNDILNYLDTRKAPNPDSQSTQTDTQTEMSRVRKIIGERMSESKRIAPHVTSFVEADLTDLVHWRNKIKNVFKEKYGVNFTFTAVFVAALAHAIRKYPLLNASVQGDQIIHHRDINIALAVALDNNELISPVIKQADLLSLEGIAVKVHDMVSRARLGQLKPEDLDQGTYTLSNVGPYRTVLGTPIIVQPQVGIMAFGTIEKKVSVIETSSGDQIGIRHKMFLSHTYDHRLIDGALGGLFAAEVAVYLENFDTSKRI